MYIRIKAKAGAKKELFEKTSQDSFLVAVKEPAEGNRANKRILELVGAHFKVLPKQIRIIFGHHSTTKILSIPD